MEILISDTNILIDLCGIGLIERCKDLDVDFRTVDFVIHEIKDPNQSSAVQKLIDSGDLTVLKFETLLQQNSRLPKDLINERINTYRL